MLGDAAKVGNSLHLGQMGHGTGVDGPSALTREVCFDL
jgi:hypothetical protein